MLELKKFALVRSRVLSAWPAYPFPFLVLKSSAALRFSSLMASSTFPAYVFACETVFFVSSLFLISSSIGFTSAGSIWSMTLSVIFLTVSQYVSRRARRSIRSLFRDTSTGLLAMVDISVWICVNCPFAARRRFFHVTTCAAETRVFLLDGDIVACCYVEETRMVARTSLLQPRGSGLFPRAAGYWF